MDNLMKKLNKKEKDIIVGLVKELLYYQNENDELIDMFVTERCFSHLKEKLKRKTRICQKLKSPVVIVEDYTPITTTLDDI